MLRTFKHFYAAVPWLYFTSCCKIHTFWNTPHSFHGFSWLKRLRENKRNSGLFHSLVFTSATFTVGKVQEFVGFGRALRPIIADSSTSCGFGKLTGSASFPYPPSIDWYLKVQVQTKPQLQALPDSGVSKFRITLIFRIWGKVAFSLI